MDVKNPFGTSEEALPDPSRKMWRIDRGTAGHPERGLPRFDQTGFILRRGRPHPAFGALVIGVSGTVAQGGSRGSVGGAARGPSTGLPEHGLVRFRHRGARARVGRHHGKVASLEIGTMLAAACSKS